MIFCEFVRILFGLTDYPETFQRYMYLVLGDAKAVVTMTYMDDGVVVLQMIEEHLGFHHITLERIRNSGPAVKPGKVQLKSSCQTSSAHNQWV